MMHANQEEAVKEENKNKNKKKLERKGRKASSNHFIFHLQ